VGEEVWVSVREWGRNKPSVELEEGGGAIVGKDERDFAEVGELVVNDCPKVGGVVRLIHEVKGVVLEEQDNPR
jgi:hypothetical protein